MTTQDAVAELDRRFSDEAATPTPWAAVEQVLEEARVSWLSTTRTDGRLHVTPLLSVWLDGAAHFCTGPDEQKAQNLGGGAHCALTTGTNALDEGLDVVIEGTAVQVGDDAGLRRLAEAYEAKYGHEWHFDVGDGLFQGDGGPALVYRVVPAKVLAFAKGPYGQTRWRFAPA